MSSSEYIYHQTADKVWSRKLYGLETLVGLLEDGLDGFTHLTNTFVIDFASSLSEETVKSSIQDAWILLRHLLPVVACKQYRLPSPDEHYVIEYTVPSSLSDAQDWANETVFFSDDIKPLYEGHCQLKEDAFWKCADNQYIAQLHISPVKNGYQASLVVAHNVIDGRNSFAVMDLFIGFLAAILEKTSTVSNLHWGDEVVRLSPPASFCKSLAETGAPPDLSKKLDVPAPIQSEGPPAQGPIPWVYAPEAVGGKADVQRLVKFSSEMTAKLHAAAQNSSKTITQVVMALSILAQAEATLKIAKTQGDKRYAEISSSYSAATHYMVAFTFVNHRHKLPGGYDSYTSPKGAPLLSIDGFPMFLPIDPLKKMIKLDELDQAPRTPDRNLFWEGLVKATADSWNAIDQSLETYAVHEAVSQSFLHNFNPNMYLIPGLVVSSIGELGRMGLVTKFSPSANNKTLTVNDVLCGIRLRLPFSMNLLYEYDGQLSCHWMAGGAFTTLESLNLIVDAFEKYTNALI